jgi:hypothetical protein
MFCIGIDYAARKFWNVQLEVDYDAGDIGDKEYTRERWKDED